MCAGVSKFCDADPGILCTTSFHQNGQTSDAPLQAVFEMRVAFPAQGCTALFGHVVVPRHGSCDAWKRRFQMLCSFPIVVE